MLGLEEGLGPVPGQLLHDVHVLATAVIPLLGKPFRILVGKYGPHGFQHRRRHEVLAGDELQLRGLAVGLGLHRISRYAEQKRLGRSLV